MHGLGNDFMVIDATQKTIELSAAQIRYLADRHTGVGFDQLLIVAPAQRPDTDFFYRIYNADGSEVEQCGNGARCFARFVQRQQLTDKSSLRVQTVSSIIELQVHENDEVTVSMGKPLLSPGDIPLTKPHAEIIYQSQIAEQALAFGAVSMGNPHAVITVTDIDTAPVNSLGPALQHSSLFPKSVNVGFMQIIDKHHIKLRVYERGAGETQACGTGACAAAVSGILQQQLQSPVHVNLIGGSLTISWEGNEQPVLMRGPATFVYEGTLRLASTLYE